LKILKTGYFKTDYFKADYFKADYFKTDLNFRIGGWGQI
jgi:hypothetical protein